MAGGGHYRSDASGAARVVADIEAAGGTAAAFQADVTDEHEVRRLATEVEKTLAPVRVVVANATGPQPEVRAEDTTWQDHLDHVVAPGWIPVERHGPLTDDDTRGYVAGVPLGRIGTTADIADVVAFVASDASRFMTGESITDNGGYTGS